MCEIPHIFPMIPYKLGMTATGFDGSAIGIDIIPSRTFRIVEVRSEKRNADEVELSIWIVDCLRYLVYMGGIAVIDELETDCSGVSLLRDRSLNCFDGIIFGTKISNKERMLIANDSRCRVINNKRDPISIKRYLGVSSLKTWRCCQRNARLHCFGAIIDKCTETRTGNICRTLNQRNGVKVKEQQYDEKFHEVAIGGSRYPSR